MGFLAEHLELLLSTPPFIYINDPTSLRITLKTTLQIVASHPFAHVNAVACFTSRLLFDTVLAAFGGDGKSSANLDAFLHGLKAVAKGRKLILLVERPERLLPDLVVPLTRLAELSQVDITTIFVSCVRWEDFKPPLGAAPDPFFIDIPTPSKQDVISYLTSNFTEITATTSHPAYHSSLYTLYTHFASLLCSTCLPFINDPVELAYISAARWPGFVQPVLDQHNIAPRDDEDDNDGEIPYISEDTRMRLIRQFTPSLTAALEALYPRLTNATEWARANHPPPNLLHRGGIELDGRRGVGTVVAKTKKTGFSDLPVISKYILIASFIASTNPAKSDLRMFGRGLDERKRKRRARKTAGKSGPAKVPQRLLGPMPFPLDRMIAILGVLLEENDVREEEEETRPGEGTEMLINRVQVYAAIKELTQMHLIHRTSPPDRLDGPPMFKCGVGVGWDAVEALGKEVGVRVGDLMWEEV